MKNNGICNSIRNSIVSRTGKCKRNSPKKPLFAEIPKLKSIGYARQSNNKQFSIDAQVEELKNAGYVVVFEEIVSNANKERPKLDSALETLEEGGEIVFKNQIAGLRLKGMHQYTP